ncbi:unnamed protein product [Closterium sp. Yama58-4]|nr:unnamed protein product [Closterium sp. Yama58-4]
MYFPFRGRQPPTSLRCLATASMGMILFAIVPFGPSHSLGFRSENSSFRRSVVAMEAVEISRGAGRGHLDVVEANFEPDSTEVTGIEFDNVSEYPQQADLSHNKSTICPPLSKTQRLAERRRAMEDGLISPLLRSDSRMGPILPSHHVPCDESTSHVAHPVRLASLDVFRGMCIVAMIVALDVGSEVPWVGVSPWDGLQLGDLVAPFFLFASGAAAALTFRAVHNRTAAVHKILGRACCLFLLGLFLEGLSISPSICMPSTATLLDCISSIASVSLPASELAEAHTPSLALTPFSSHSPLLLSLTPFSSHSHPSSLTHAHPLSPHTDLSLASPSTFRHLPGGFLHRAGDLSFGISLTRMRICGTLQRIAVAYAVVALAQMLLSAPKDSHTDGYGEGLSGLLSFSLLTWQASLMLAAIYLALTFLLFVPDWTFTPPTSSASRSAVNATFLPHAASPASNTSPEFLVVCSRTGDLSPACSAAGYIDRLLLTTNHLLASPPYIHLPVCGVPSTPLSPPSLLALPSSGDQAPPVWCSAPFEPMGLLSTLGATLTAFMGLHLGHIITSFQSHAARIINCLLFSALLMAAGFLLQFPFSFSLHDAIPHANIPEWLDISYPGLPFNAQLYSLSYVLITAGAAALLFALIYLFVDAAGVCFYTLLFEWMGRNSLFLFLTCATPLLSSIAAGFYWEDPQKNLVSLLHNLLLWAGHDSKTAAIMTAATILALEFLTVCFSLYLLRAHWKVDSGLLHQSIRAFNAVVRTCQALRRLRLSRPMAAFLVITLIFFALGFLGCVLVRVLYDKGPSTNLLHVTLVITATICCWLSWAIVYMAQMHPLVVPILKAEGE